MLDPRFKISMRVSGKSRSTITNYTTVLNAAFRQMGDTSSEEKWLEFLSNKLDEISSSGVNKYIKALKCWGRFKGGEWSWTESLKKIKEKSVVKQILTDEEIRKIIDVDPPPSQYGVLLSIIAYTGSRSTEASLLEKKHVDFKTDSIVFEFTKTDPRRVFMHKALRDVLYQYINSLDREKLFVARASQLPPKQPSINKEFKRRLELAGINKKTSVHSLRHSFITDLLNNEANLIDVQRQVGHKKADTTAVYRHNSLKALKNAVTKLSLGKSSLTPEEQFGQLVDELKLSGILDNDSFYYEITNKSVKIEIKSETQRSE